MTDELKYTLGADPEIFLIDDEGNPKPVVGLLGGSKEEPREVMLGAVQEDNVLAEFNIHPAKDANEFVGNITSVMGELAGLLPQYKLNVVPSMEFDLFDLLNSGDQAMVFGCDPDWDAWTGEINNPPDPTSTMRTAGGHVHIGFDGLDEGNVQQFVQCLDIYLGIPSVLLDRDVGRRKMYGKAGAYRPKPYGVEYRTLSNFWIENELYIRWVHHNVGEAIRNFHRLDEMLEKFEPEVVRTTINDSLSDSAIEIIKALNIPMPKAG